MPADLLLGAALPLLLLAYVIAYKVVEAWRITRPGRAWRRDELRRIKVELAEVQAWPSEGGAGS